MGQAKQRGTRDERVAQAIERERSAAEKRSAEHRLLMIRQAEQRARQQADAKHRASLARKMSGGESAPVVVVGGGGDHRDDARQVRTLLGHQAVLGAALAMLIVPPAEPKKKR